MVSLYYKPLTSQMKSFRKQLNMQELNDQLHNLKLKELLNKDNEKYNQEANKVQREQIRNQIKERLNPKKQAFSKEYNENIANDKLQSELNKKDYDYNRNKQKLIDELNPLLKNKLQEKNDIFVENIEFS